MWTKDNESRAFCEVKPAKSGECLDKIIICDNNDVGNENQINIIASLKEKYDINAINVCGREMLEKVGLQTGCYKFCYEYIFLIENGQEKNMI